MEAEDVIDRYMQTLHNVNSKAKITLASLNVKNELKYEQRATILK